MIPLTVAGQLPNLTEFPFLHALKRRHQKKLFKRTKIKYFESLQNIFLQNN